MASLQLQRLAIYALAMDTTQSFILISQAGCTWLGAESGSAFSSGAINGRPLLVVQQVVVA